MNEGWDETEVAQFDLSAAVREASSTDDTSARNAVTIVRQNATTRAVLQT